MQCGFESRPLTAGERVTIYEPLKDKGKNHTDLFRQSLRNQPGWARQPRDVTAPTKKNKKEKMIFNKKSKTELSGFYIVYDGATMNEYKGVYGISHLIEHLMCNKIKEIEDDMHQDGIVYNASTSSHNVGFHIHGLDKYVKKYRNKIFDIVTHLDITRKILDNEKRIVIEEYNNYFNNQAYAHLSNLKRRLLNHYGAGGLREDLENLSLKNVIDFHGEHFTRPSKVFNISKSNPFTKRIKFEERSEAPEVSFEVISSAPWEDLGKFEKESSIINISPVIHKDFAIIDFICDMLSLGLTSPLYKEIREKRGLVYYLWCYQMILNLKNSAINIATVSSNENVDKIQDLIRKVLRNKSMWMTPARFKMVKNYHLIREKKLQIELYKNAMQCIDVPPEWDIDIVLRTLTLDKVRAVYDKYFDIDGFYRSVDKEEFKGDKKAE